MAGQGYRGPGGQIVVGASLPAKVKPIKPLILDNNYVNLKNQVIKKERQILKELGFCVHVKHPHKIIVSYLRVLDLSNKQLLQKAW
ncbi:unnamed protein product [Cyprideis torosa]|uniref:Uncharacterized protein n=1 Tax=Cyprideis torosa TaxID=163714 RepID=A0A7R8W382_9CRUS|nr:unnamed protein product [Cyprideis torosa]CAG0882721.1 unnamed protein product [Cyprideis torosa]